MNKQYTEQEYYRIAKEIIQYMKETGEWGEFISPSISLFGYNESVAQEYYPLSRNEALEKGYRWFDQKNYIQIPADALLGSDIPDSICDVQNSILEKSIVCEITGKPFKIIDPELDFYRKYTIPIPRRHPNRRQYDRMNMRNERKLYHRKCADCGTPILTTYNPKDNDIIYCETCYLEAVN